jgi:hypothetical protein
VLKPVQARRRANWLAVGEAIDTLRIFPRIVLIWYGVWVAYRTDTVWKWYTTLPTTERTGAVTAVIGIIIPAMWGAAIWVYKVYAVGGRDWDKADEPYKASGSRDWAPNGDR